MACLLACLLAAMSMAPLLEAADLDGDGLDDAWEAASGYSPLLYTRIVYVDAVEGDDTSGDGVSAATALKSLGAALSLDFAAGCENVILAAPGTYSGAANRELDFSGQDFLLRSSGGAAQTIIDLEGAGRLLTLTDGETPASVLEGFTVRNGYRASCGTAVHLSGASLTIRDCVFEDNRSGREVAYEYGEWTETRIEDAESTAAVFAENAPVRIVRTVFRRNVSSASMYAGMGMDNAGALLLAGADGSVVEDCCFLGNGGQGAGAAVLYGTDATFRRCRFQWNHSFLDGGALSACQLWDSQEGAMDGCGIVMENCLLLGNSAFSDCSDLCFGAGCTAVLKHVTVSGGTAWDGHSVRFGGDACVFNSILDGMAELADGIVFTADHSCSRESFAAYGSGNILGSPALTGAGVLTSASVCRGAGGQAGFLPADIAGNARDASCIDLGCRAFTDTDSDGIPDDAENAAGMDPASATDASGDADGDGLTNLQEYLLGTDISAPDTDGDGTGDAAEVAQERNPLLPARIIHVNPVAGDDTDSGLSALSAKRTLSAAVSAARCVGCENIVLAAPGLYSGTANRGLDFGGCDIRLVSTGGAAQTVIDLEQSGPLLSLSGHETLESRLDGFTVRNGYAASYGIAVHLANASLDIRGCVFENNCSGRKVTWEWDGYAETRWEDANATAAVYASGAPVRITGTVFRGNISRETMQAGMDTGNAGAVLLCNSAGSVISGCGFISNAGYGAGAVAVSGATLDIRRSRFFHNLSFANGGALAAFSGWDDSEGSLAVSHVYLENSLCIGNRALLEGSDLYLGDGCGVEARNSTIAGGTSWGGHSVRLGGDSTIVNCIVRGTVAVGGGIVPEASNNCTGEDWSAYGTGNISSDPMLTGAGMLKAGSPCIDAGTSAFPPDEDLFGNTRPAGSGVDIGCHEFLDTDSDGIPDFLEGEDGILPGGDEDGDGLENLREYLIGTEIFTADTDGDGDNDGDELADGFNPLCRTRILFVSADGNDAGSGQAASTAKQTLAAALAAMQAAAGENVIKVLPGTYSGSSNRNLDFGGCDIKLVSTGGAAQTVIDLEQSGPLLSLSGHETLESRLDGFTVRNGYAASYGIAVHLANASLDIRGCVFENNCSGRKVTWEWDGYAETRWEDANATAAVYASGAPVRITGTVFRGNISRETMQAGMDTGNAGAVLLCNSAGSVISGCGFISNAGYGAGAVAVSGATLDIRRSRFFHNLSFANGGAISASADGYYYDGEDMPDTSVSITDCLLSGNRASLDFSDLYFGGGCTTFLLNATIADGFARDGHSSRFGGDTRVVNSILDGATVRSSEILFTVLNCCTRENWSSFGTGNISSDPMLTGAGMLKAGSPCIDAGTSAFPPDEDLFGNTRPAGSGVDIGCHEFLDTDSDGIPDFLEGEDGILPGGDEDGDGLENLREYLIGTEIFTADTDGDGDNDGSEQAAGRDPLLPANIAYVSPSGNDAADGRTAATAKATFAAALELERRYGTENIVYAAAGTYSGSGNCSLDFEGFDISICGASGVTRTVIDLAGGTCFLSLRQGETERSRLAGLSFVRSRNASPAITLDGAALTVSGCSFRNFTCTGNPEDYLCYDYDFTTACILRLADASCRLEDVVIAYCSYSPSCPLITCEGSSLSLERCRIVGNETGYGPLFRIRDTSLDMENTMVAKNNAASSGCIGLLYDSSLFRAVNCTFAANAVSAASALSGDGSVVMLNTIFAGLVSGCSVALSHCVTDTAYADAAAGCFAGGAGLAGGLFLTPDSPCIDAGTADGAPSSDFAGTPRPQGTGVDIGCEEYCDSDGDGISDFYSAWCGGNLSAGGDLDQDGLSDLQEMLLGTDAGVSDTDGDGMPDGWEASNGLDPLHDDAEDDPDGDGLLNIDENANGTDPMEPDTDGDGQEDGWEAHIAFSNPAVVDFNGAADSVVSLTGNLFSDSGGGWEADGSGARARGRSGWLQYSVQVSFDGVYLLELGVSEAGTASAGTFTVSCRVDGASCGSLIRISLDAMQEGTGVCMTPFLRAGLHSLRIDWDNVYRNTSLRVDSIRLVALGGPDADSDGVPDWAENRLANMSCTVLPERSRVSPVCVEGGNASYIETIAISGYYVAQDEADPHPPVRRIAGNRWYADLPLDPDGATPVSVSVSYQNSARTVSGSVLWETVDTAALDGDTVRLDDEMLLGADLPEGVQAWTLTIGGMSFEMARGDVRRHRFTAAGDTAVSASWVDADGEQVSNEAVIHVLAADFGSEPVCHAGTERTWRIAGIGGDVRIEIDREVQSTDLGCSGGSRQFLLRGTVSATAYATARIREDGPVLDTTAVHVIETATHVGDGYHRVIADFGDGTVLYDGYVVAGQVIEGMSVSVTLWGTNSTFEDGTQEKTFTWENFDASGELHFSILGGRSFTTCMTVILYQDGEEVWRLQ